MPHSADEFVESQQSEEEFLKVSSNSLAQSSSLEEDEFPCNRSKLKKRNVPDQERIDSDGS